MSNDDEIEDTLLEELYRRDNSQQPPEHLDTAIKELAAQTQTQLKPHKTLRTRTAQRWMTGIASAAVVVLSVGVYRNIEVPESIQQSAIPVTKPAASRFDVSSDAEPQNAATPSAAKQSAAKEIRLRTEAPDTSPHGATDDATGSDTVATDAASGESVSIDIEHNQPLMRTAAPASEAAPTQETYLQLNSLQESSEQAHSERDEDADACARQNRAVEVYATTEVKRQLEREYDRCNEAPMDEVSEDEVAEEEETADAVSEDQTPPHD